jgi:iron complex outermembrane receptor protein
MIVRITGFGRGAIMTKYSLLQGACAFALMGSTQAEAAAAAAAQPQPQSSSTASQPSDPTEIVITARRRSENLMRTPIAATILSGTDLTNKGVTNVDTLQFVTPNVTVNNFGQGNDFNVRGIGKAEHNTQTTTGVITYRDGAPSFPGYFQGEPYFDVANIQVLRGPQGTIVGQNATGGAVFVNTNDPSIHGGVHGYAQIHYGNFDEIGAEGAINIPIGDTLAARAAIYTLQRNSFYTITGPGGAPYLFNKGEPALVAGRVSLLWRPTKQLSILWKNDFDFLKYGAYPADPYTDRFKTLPGTTTPNPNYRDLFNITANAPMGARDKFFRSILRADYTLDSGIRLRSVSALSRGETYYLTDLDGTSANVSTFGDTVYEKQISQELNVISPDDQRLTWLVGAFGLWNKYTFAAPYKLFIGLPGFGIPNYYDLQGTNPTRSLAAFGQVGYAITPDLKLDVGGRYTASRSTNHVLIRQFGAFVTPDEETTSSDNFSYKVSLGWQVNPDHYLYAFVASGFRPGGLNTPDLTTPVPPKPFGPETVRSLEAGWKANLAGGHLRTTVAGFYNAYRHFQAILGRPDNPRLSTQFNVSGTTKIYGAEAEADLRFGDLSMSAGVGLLHSELGTFYAVDPRNIPPAAPPSPLCNPASGPATAYCINLTGVRQTYAPEFTFNASAQYVIHLGPNDSLTPRANFGHVGMQWATLFEKPQLGDRIDERSLVNAQLAWTHGNLTVTAYGMNLTDKHYVVALNSGLDFAGAPRQYGIKLETAF